MKARLGMIEVALAKAPFMGLTHSLLAGDSPGDIGLAAGGGRSIMVCRVQCTPVRGLGPPTTFIVIHRLPAVTHVPPRSGTARRSSPWCGTHHHSLLVGKALL
jgi:hypothetical protein